MSELERARQRLAAKDEEQRLAKQQKEKDARRIEEEYTRIKPDLLAMQNRFWSDPVNNRILRLADESARTIERVEKSNLAKEITFEYGIGRDHLLTVDHTGKSDTEKAIVEVWKRGNLDPSSSPNNVTIFYKSKSVHVPPPRGQSHYHSRDVLSYHFYIYMSLSKDQIEFRGSFSKDDKGVDTLAEEVYSFLKKRDYVWYEIEDWSKGEVGMG